MSGKTIEVEQEESSDDFSKWQAERKKKRQRQRAESYRRNPSEPKTIKERCRVARESRKQRDPLYFQKNIQDASVQETQTDSDDSNVPLRRKENIMSSSSEINFEEVPGDSVQKSEYRNIENGSESDCISTSAELSPAEKSAEADRRYRFSKTITKPSKPPPQTSAERSKAYRERQKKLEEAAKIISKDIKINLKKANAPTLTAAERSRVYRERQRILVQAAKIITRDKINFREKEEVVNYQEGRRRPKTSAEKCRDYRERKRRLIMNAGITIREKEIANLRKKITTKKNEDGTHTNVIKPKVPLRSVLTLDERVAAIQLFATVPMYDQIARNFNCSKEQIIRVVSNRKAILEFNQTTIILSTKCNEDSEVRRRKMNLLGYCLYEYIQRAQYHLFEDVSEEGILQRAIDFRDLMAIDDFTPKKRWIQQFMAAYDVKSSNCQEHIEHRPRMSLDLKNIMSHCVRQYAMASNWKPKNLVQLIDHAKTLQNTSGQILGTSIELDSDNEDDCVPIEHTEDINNSPELLLTEELNDNSLHSSLKIEQLQHSPLRIADFEVLDEKLEDIPTVPSPSPEPPLPRCVESFKDALLLLKPLEDWALMGENYRVIGLLSQLEEIFEAGKKAEEMILGE